jgi:hypothetical protein
MPLCLGGHAYCRVNRPVLLVTADALDDFKEEPILEGLRVGVQEFAGVVAIIQQIERAQLRDARIAKAPLGLQVIV